MEEDLANLNISEEEEAPLLGQGNVDMIEEDYRLCLVGRVLTDSVVHFLSTRNTLADLWHTLEELLFQILRKRVTCSDFIMRLM
ncbi:hypothetical protein Godav_002607 [Gossypium davidsonii]|uniref:Uncharacterized protein n=2 Tax=Gossypium TaxID=3633 RepID=A0A7J8SYC5_GOSDV|nr:hypothetical protein [Gossypium davidsonii]MBA0666232.1 hypothetical protein [Gossypium klotzschianum]